MHTWIFRHHLRLDEVLQGQLQLGWQASVQLGSSGELSTAQGW